MYFFFRKKQSKQDLLQLFSFFFLQPNAQVPVIHQHYSQQLQNGQQHQTQYVQLANGMLVPMSSLQQPQQNVISTSPNHPYAQLMPMPTPHQAVNQNQMTQPLINQTSQHPPVVNQMSMPQPIPNPVSNQQSANRMSPRPQQPLPVIDPLLEHFVDTATLPPKQISHQPSMTSLQAAQQFPGNQEFLMPAHQNGGGFTSQLPGGPSHSRPSSRSNGKIKSAIKYHQEEENTNSEDDFEIPNNHLAQRKQVDRSSDMGMKCSQI